MEQQEELDLADECWRKQLRGLMEQQQELDLAVHCAARRLGIQVGYIHAYLVYRPRCSLYLYIPHTLTKPHGG